MAKNTKDNFDQVLADMAANAKAYEAKSIRFIDYSAKNDSILEAHGWNRKEYLQELYRRAQSGIPGVRRG